MLNKKDLKSLETRVDKKIDKAMEKQTKIILKALDFGINGVKKDVAGLKTDVSSLKIDVLDLKTDVADLKIRVTKLEEKTDKSLTQQDKICKELHDMRTENKMNFDLYNKHDKRISNLEIQPASHE